MNSDSTLSGTCPTFPVITNSQLARNMTATQCIQPHRCCADDLIRFKASIRMEKIICMLIYARRADLSILQPADLLGFFPFHKISKLKKGSILSLIVNKNNQSFRKKQIRLLKWTFHGSFKMQLHVSSVVLRNPNTSQPFSYLCTGQPSKQLLSECMSAFINASFTWQETHGMCSTLFTHSLARSLFTTLC